MSDVSEAEVEAAAFAICGTELEGCDLCSLETMRKCACLTQARAALTVAAQVRKAGLMPIYGAKEADGADS